MRRRAALVNSTVAFALALLAMITVHELAHGVVALTQGQRPVIHLGSETDSATTVGARVLVALGGPVWSLLSGAAVLALPQVRASLPFLRLAVLWFAPSTRHSQQMSSSRPSGPSRRVSSCSSCDCSSDGFRWFKHAPTFGWPVAGAAALLALALVRIVVFGPGLTL